MTQQPALPGLTRMKPQTPSKPYHPFAENPRSKWSGPIPGQQVMGVHDLGGDGPWKRTYEVDHTGMVQEKRETAGPTAPERAVGSSVIAHRFYASHGGGRADDLLTRATHAAVAAGHDGSREGTRQYLHGQGYTDPYIDRHVQESADLNKHWDSQPLHHIPADAPVHTGQSHLETLAGHDDGSDPRIRRIRQSLQNGGEIQKPAWVMKKAGRLYNLDGHHRVMAAREEGAATYPARVWDYDAEQKKRSSGTSAAAAMGKMMGPR